jgi:peptide/nickel transport system substrate-binding protein
MTVRALALVAAATVAVLTLGTALPGAGAPVKNPETLVYLTAGDVESLDPAYAYDTSSEAIIWPTVYETLITYDGSLTSRYVPVLATTVPSLANGLISADGLTYTFPIRQGVRFHDGSLMTPEDVRYSILRFMLQDRDGGPSWLLLSPLLGHDSTREDGKIAVTYQEAARAVTVVGHDVVFHLNHPYGAFLSIMAAWSFVMSRSWAASHGDWDGSPGTWQAFNNPKLQDRYAFDHMDGTGPFKLAQWDRQAKEIILVRNDNYWRTPARLARVVVRTVEEFTTRRLALEQGDADIIDVNRADQSKVMGMSGVTIRDDLPTLGVQAIYFTLKIDTTANPDVGSGKLDGDGIPPDFFTDIHVRRAFAYAFDYQAYIRDGYRGKAIPATGPIIQGLLGYDPAAPRYTHDRDKATAEFKEAWGGRVWDAGFKFTTTYNTGNVARQIGAEIIKDQVESLNPKFKIDTRAVPWSSILQLTVAHKITIFQIGWFADYPDPDDFVQPFLSSNGDYPKRSGYSNPEADRLIQKAAATADPGKRTAIYRQLTKIAYDDVPGIYPAQPTAFMVMRSWVHGWYFNPILPAPGQNAGENFYTLYKE